MRRNGNANLGGFKGEKGKRPDVVGEKRCRSKLSFSKKKEDASLRGRGSSGRRRQPGGRRYRESGRKAG